MFRRRKDGRISSDMGFSIKLNGRAGLDYFEDNKVLHVNSEMLNNNKVGYVVEKNSIVKWNDSDLNLNEHEKARILSNIKEAFRYLGYEIEVVAQF